MQMKLEWLMITVAMARAIEVATLKQRSQGLMLELQVFRDYISKD